MSEIKKYPLSISVSKAKELYGNYKAIRNSFTINEKQFVESKTLNGKYSLLELYNLLSKVTLYFQLVKDRRDNITGYTILGSVIFGIATIVAIANDVQVFAVVFGLLAIAILIFSFSLKKELEMGDFEMKSPEVVKGVLYVLMKDFGPKQSVAFELDGTKVKHQENVIDRYEKYGRKITLFQKDYFQMKLTINNDIKFVLQDSTILKLQKWKKRSASGKTKYKSKTKYMDKLLYRVEFDDTTYKYRGENLEEIFQPTADGVTSKIEHCDNTLIYKSKIKLQTEVLTGSTALQELVKYLQLPFLVVQKK